MAKIRDTENSQCVAELTQKISNLEFKVAKSFFGSDRSPRRGDLGSPSVRPSVRPSVCLSVCVLYAS